MKTKKCKICKKSFEPTRQLQPTCNSIDCMTQYANKHLKSKQLKAKREASKALKAFNDSDINILKKKAQTACNAYIRKRDENEPCISCGYNGNGRQWHAGHYRPSGGNSLLRFNELNIFRQCSICNNHLSGNLVLYRENLIKKIGLEKVEELESMNTTKRWSKEELQEIIKYYKDKIKLI